MMTSEFTVDDEDLFEALDFLSDNCIPAVTTDANNDISLDPNDLFSIPDFMGSDDALYE